MSLSNWNGAGKNVPGSPAPCSHPLSRVLFFFFSLLHWFLLELQIPVFQTRVARSSEVNWLEVAGHPGSSDSSSSQRAMGSRGKSGAGEVLFAREEHQLAAKWSALKTHIQIMLYELRRLYLGIYLYICIHICIYMHIIPIEGRRGHEFEWDWGEVDGSFAERKGKGEMLLL